MIYLISYDIEIDRIRTKIAKMLIAEGYERLQLSVFVGIHDPVKNSKLWRFLKEWCNTEDSASQLIVIKVSKEQFKRMHILGNQLLDIAYLCGDQQTLII